MIYGLERDYMYDNILSELIEGKNVKCPKCHIGDINPFNTTADKAHYFDCSNEECDWYMHFDPIIEIE